MSTTSGRNISGRGSSIGGRGGRTAAGGGRSVMSGRTATGRGSGGRSVSGRTAAGRGSGQSVMSGRAAGRGGGRSVMSGRAAGRGGGGRGGSPANRGPPPAVVMLPKGGQHTSQGDRGPPQVTAQNAAGVATDRVRFESMKYRELQKECKNRKLQATGTKDQLVNRLLEGQAVHPDNANANATTTIPWGSSKAKAFLQEELAKGDPSSHPFWVKTPAEAWASDQQFREYPKNNFCNNLRNYRKKTRVQMQSIKFEDAAAVQHNNLFRFTSDKNNRGNPRMHNHPGKRWLELDVAAGNANGRKPAELKKDRPEYAEFGTIQFGKRVVGDSGYVGEPDKVSTTLAGHSDATKELFARLKSRQETLFRGYKALGIMGGKPFRHKGKQGGGSEERMAVHRLVFRAVRVVMQYNMESRPLFDV